MKKSNERDVFSDPPAFLAAKSKCRRKEGIWRSSFTAQEWQTRMDDLYGPRGDDGHRHVLIDIVS